MRFEKDSTIPVEKDPEKSRSFDHEERRLSTWSSYLESARLEAELNTKKIELYSILLLAFTLGVSLSESCALGALGERSSVSFLTRLSTGISSPADGFGELFIFIALLIMRCLLGECFRQVGANYCYGSSLKQNHEKTHLESDADSLNSVNTAISRSKLCLLGLGGLALYSFKSDTSRLSTSLMLSSIPHILNLTYHSLKQINPPPHATKDFDQLSKLFPKKTFRLEQARYEQGGQIKRSNLFLLKYSREKVPEETLIAYMRKRSSYLAVIDAKVEEGLIFSVKKGTELEKIKPFRNRPQARPGEEKVLDGPNDPDEEVQEVILSASEEKGKNRVLSGKKKGTARLHKAGARIALDPSYDKKGMVSQTAGSSKNKRLPMQPEWLRTYDEACQAIIEANSLEGESLLRIFVYGSAMEDIRNQREIPYGSDIDLCILILETHSFQFPIDLKPLSRFPNEYNNVACDFKGLKIDITLKYSSHLNPNDMISSFLEGNDFSHTRTVIPYNKNFICERSEHTQACIDMRILSAYPRKAKAIFLENPYRIFRAFSALFSGYSLVDEDMFCALSDSALCLGELSKLKPERIFWGLHKLLNRTHPALVLDQFNRMGFLNRYFKEAGAMYELTFARVHFVYSALIGSIFNKDMSAIYAVLLWPTFSRDDFYQAQKTHFSRIQQFFKSKAREGILFPGRAKNPDGFEGRDFGVSDLQIKISWLFYGLSQDLKAMNEPFNADEFAQLKTAWIEQYHALCKDVLTKAFTKKLPGVDMAALRKEHLYSKPCPSDEAVLSITGPLRSFLA